MTDNLVVIDASTAIKALLPNPQQAFCLALVRTFTEVQPVAPALWAYETTSAIVKAVYFGQITETEAHQSLAKLDSLGVHLFISNSDQNRVALNWTLKLNRASVYDSYYLALAQALECDFWTADRHLFNALKDSNQKWVHWIEELSPLT